MILDASFPHKSFKSDRFICQMKIADPDSPINKEGVVEHCTLMMFAKRFEDLPIIQRVGDIIRVHRAHVQTYKGVKQFTCNIFFNSSWALFSPMTGKDRMKKEDEQVKNAQHVNEAKAILVKGTTDPREVQPLAYLGKPFPVEVSEKKTSNGLPVMSRGWGVLGRGGLGVGGGGGFGGGGGKKKLKADKERRRREAEEDAGGEEVVVATRGRVARPGVRQRATNSTVACASSWRTWPRTSRPSHFVAASSSSTAGRVDACQVSSR